MKTGFANWKPIEFIQFCKALTLVYYNDYGNI